MEALGRHILLEFYECDEDLLNHVAKIKELMVEAAKRAQAAIVDTVFHEFSPAGISGVVVIAESHFSIHTWPEYRYAAVDIFTCGETLQPEKATEYLAQELKTQRVFIQEIKRGVFVRELAKARY